MQCGEKNEEGIIDTKVAPFHNVNIKFSEFGKL